jgi:uncharacterized protein (DUF58 family)
METKELLKHLRHLEIRTKGLTNAIFSGKYHSAFKGRGMAFSEVRNYQYGDEVRTIDWNVTARYNDPFVKVFEEERELTIMLVIDVSGSQFFGTKQRSKRDLATEIAAILAFSAVNNNDKVGALLVSNKVEKYIPPKKGTQHALYILRTLIDLKAESLRTDLSEGLNFFRNTQKKRCTCFLISDFLDENLALYKALRWTKKRHDLIALQLSDPAERELPNMGWIQLLNAETGGKNWVNSASSEVRENYQMAAKEQISFVETSLQRLGISTAKLSTGEDIVKPLYELFQQRK